MFDTTQKMMDEQKYAIEQLVFEEEKEEEKEIYWENFWATQH